MGLPQGFVPDVAVVLNLSPDHLARHGDMGTYAAHKVRLLSNSMRRELVSCPSPMSIWMLRRLMRRVAFSIAWMRRARCVSRALVRNSG